MGSGRDWRLPWYAWFLIGPPLLTFVVANAILTQWGGADFQVAQPVSNDGHLEAAGRLRTFATFLLYAAFAVGSSVYAFYIALRLAPKHRWWLGCASLATLVAGAIVVRLFHLDRGDEYLEIDFACASFEQLQPSRPVSQASTEQQAAVASRDRAEAREVPQHGEAAARAGSEDAEAATPQGQASAAQELPRPPRVARTALACPGRGAGAFAIPAPRQDGNNSYRQLRLTYLYAALLLIVATPLLVWGAIACLALPEHGSARERHGAWVSQTASLNRLLYITAAFLIAGLFYSSARWSWPGYSLHAADAGAFSEHVRSLVLYLGVLNSVLIASYYLPVAALLARLEPDRPRGGAAAPPGAEESRNPFAVYRTALTILSPAILGLLGELLKFSP